MSNLIDLARHRGQEQPQSCLTDAQRHAIEEAQNGNWGPADTLELAYLNDPTNGIRPHRGGQAAFPEANLKAVAILRGYAPGNQLGVEWGSPCAFCGGSGQAELSGPGGVRAIDCPDCDASGEADESVGRVITDIDGLIIEESEA